LLKITFFKNKQIAKLAQQQYKSQICRILQRHKVTGITPNRWINILKVGTCSTNFRIFWAQNLNIHGIIKKNAPLQKKDPLGFLFFWGGGGELINVVFGKIQFYI
jgi:hypothetical protein